MLQQVRFVEGPDSSQRLESQIGYLDTNDVLYFKESWNCIEVHLRGGEVVYIIGEAIKFAHTLVATRGC